MSRSPISEIANKSEIMEEDYRVIHDYLEQSDIDNEDVKLAFQYAVAKGHAALVECFLNKKGVSCFVDDAKSIDSTLSRSMTILRIQCEVEVIDKDSLLELNDLAIKLHKLHKILFPWPICNRSRSLDSLKVNHHPSYRMICYQTAQWLKPLSDQSNDSGIPSYYEFYGIFSHNQFYMICLQRAALLGHSKACEELAAIYAEKKKWGRVIFFNLAACTNVDQAKSRLEVIAPLIEKESRYKKVCKYLSKLDKTELPYGFTFYQFHTLPKQSASEVKFFSRLSLKVELREIESCVRNIFLEAGVPLEMRKRFSAAPEKSRSHSNRGLLGEKEAQRYSSHSEFKEAPSDPGKKPLSQTEENADDSSSESLMSEPEDESAVFGLDL